MNAEEKDLLHRHLNGDLDVAEQAAFFAQLQSSPELRRELASLATDEMLLSELVLEGRTAAPAPRRTRTWIPGAIAAALLLGLSLILILGRGASTGLRVVAVAGAATLQRGDIDQPLRPGIALLDGDRIATAKGRATLEKPGTVVEVQDDTSVVLRDRGAHLRLEHGIVDARADGLVLSFELGAAQLRKANARVDVAPDRTRVEAEEGSVVVERADWPQLDIAAGEYARMEPLQRTTTGRIVRRAIVDDAVRRGCAFLESRRSDLVVPITSEKRHGTAPRRTYAELALLALHRAGIPDSDPLKAELLGSVKGRSVDSTYGAALQAMALAEIDPLAHHDRIRLCAQLLVDSQCRNGQWDYAVKLAVPDVPAAGRIRRRSEGPAAGDNSVTSYAVLGLHACSRAGIEIDPDVLARARAWWLQCQNGDGGWGYNDAGDAAANDASRRTATTNSSYGSATASGVASLAAIRDLQKDPRSDDAIRRGLQWLGGNFAVDRNPRKDPGFVHLHWLVTAARAGVVLGTERFGAHDWYAEGAEFLMGSQRPTGQWTVEQGDFMKAERNDVLDTCLAILFLRNRR